MFYINKEEKSPGFLLSTFTFQLAEHKGREIVIIFLESMLPQVTVEIKFMVTTSAGLFACLGSQGRMKKIKVSVSELSCCGHTFAQNSTCIRNCLCYSYMEYCQGSTWVLLTSGCLDIPQGCAFNDWIGLRSSTHVQKPESSAWSWEWTEKVKEEKKGGKKQKVGNQKGVSQQNGRKYWFKGKLMLGKIFIWRIMISVKFLHISPLVWKTPVSLYVFAW